MKKFICLVLVLMIVLALGVPAMADSTVVGSTELDAWSIEFNPVTNTMGVRYNGNDVYTLIDAEGTALTTEPYISMDAKEDMFEVAVESGVNVTGLIDGQGNPVIPMQYGDINYLSSRWQIGVILEEATAENYDYSSFFGNDYYLVSGYDVYYNGAKIGSLDRMDYRYGYAYGDFLYVGTRDDRALFYDSQFNPSGYESNYYSGEYETSNGAIWHKGSNQEAFVAGCTLTPEQVEQPLYEKNGQLLDLQGNIVADVSKYDYFLGYKAGYFRVSLNGKEGIIDSQGNEVIPCEYDSIGSSSNYFGAGYQLVVKDDKVGFVNTKGEETCPFTYSSTIADTYYSPFSSLNDLEGNTIVISGQIGELPTRYTKVSFNSSNTCPMFAAVDLEGNAGVIDLAGKTVIPFDGTYTNTYNFSFSNDGSVVLAGNQGPSTIFRLSTDAAASDADTAEADGSAGETETPACSNCGYVPEGEVPNFCPECGTPFPK